MNTASKILFILFCYCCIQFLQAAVSQGIFYNEANPGKCSYESLVLSPGETAKAPNDCFLFRCDNSDGWATITSCIAIAPPPHCIWSHYLDVNAPYPVCCARSIQCVEMSPSNETLTNQYVQNIYEMFSNSVPVEEKLT